MERTECVLVESITHALFKRFGEGPIRVLGRDLSFEIRPEFGGGQCATEEKLSYMLEASTAPDVKMDILLRSPAGKTIGIECKFLSSVSDQFKSRAYDMIHLKKKYGERLFGIMLYVHVRGFGGLGLTRAAAYCHPYDRFLGYEVNAPEGLHGLQWSELYAIVAEQLLPAVGSSPAAAD
jgi:hypothetical protein